MLDMCYYQLTDWYIGRSVRLNIASYSSLARHTKEYAFNQLARNIYRERTKVRSQQ